jgi:hypothetical protein
MTDYNNKFNTFLNRLSFRNLTAGSPGSESGIEVNDSLQSSRERISNLRDEKINDPDSNFSRYNFIGETLFPEGSPGSESEPKPDSDNDKFNTFLDKLSFRNLTAGSPGSESGIEVDDSIQSSRERISNLRAEKINDPDSNFSRYNNFIGGTLFNGDIPF